MQHFSIGFFDEGHIISSFIYTLFEQVPVVEIHFNERIEKLFVETLSKKTPDVLLMNLIRKSQINEGLVKKIKNDFPGIKIVGFVYGTELSQEAVFRLINSGVVSILTDTHSPEDILQTVKTVAEKGFHMNEVVNEAMIAYCKRKKLLCQSFGPAEKLTEREIIIIGEKKAGKTSKEIAGQLYVSKKTVDGILQNLYSRFDCRNFHELVRKTNPESLARYMF